MAMKIAHISDTHLGRRPKQTRPPIINQEIRSLEDDFYSAWLKFVDEIVDSGNDRPDIILHCGDFFDTPAGYDLSPPPEYARKIAAKTFKQLEDAGIPLVIIDGNHGRYMQYRTSTLSEYPIAFDNVHLFTHYDVRDSLKKQKPLLKDFPNLNLRIIAHPSIESSALSALGIEPIYKKWIQLQNSSTNPDMINIAMAHGMVENSTLDPDFFKGTYHYVALGDDHKMHKVTDNAWYSGSTELWNFSEFGTEKGYLIVEVERGKAYPKVTPGIITSSRKAVCETVDVSSSDTNSEIIKNVKNLLDSHGLKEEYEYSTAARVKIFLKGEKTYGASFNIGEVESYLRKLVLDSNDYNIVEFILDGPDYREYTKTGSAVARTLDDYVDFLIEDAEKEFREYVTAARSDDLKKQNLDPSLLAKIFAKALSSSLKGSDEI
jgi:DNA repair exonuclease SbcCD nuclease subunit